MITVLICTYNRGDLINNTLRSLIQGQTQLADEIIVVNGGGQNDCSSAIALWQTQCNYLIEIKTENINLANSRNIGLKAAQGDLVLMTDDDAEVFPDWIAQMQTAHMHYPDAGCIGGEVVDRGGDTILSRLADAITFPKYDTVKEVRTVPGVNCSYKRKVLEAIGPQDISLFRGEDVDFNWRVIQAGFKVLYVPDIKVYHYHRSTWKGLFNQHYMYGRAYYRVRKKWPNMYSAYPRHIKSVKMLIKAMYLPFLPWHHAWLKVKALHSFKDKFLGYLMFVAISYISMYGTFKQYIIDSKRIV